MAVDPGRLLVAARHRYFEERINALGGAVPPRRWVEGIQDVDDEENRPGSLARALRVAAEERINALRQRRQVADWLVNDLDYPIGVSTPDHPPPVWLRRAIEDAWIRLDGDADVGDDDIRHRAIRRTVAEEGGWA
jgi:hypothetical protein